MSDKWIRASDITAYVYCRRSWWLQRRRGYAPENERVLAAGNRFHREHGQLYRRSNLARRLAYALLFIVVAVITFQVLVSLGV